MLPVFSPSSPQAAPIVSLFVFVLIACAVILVLVTGLVVYACFRYRRKPGQGDPPQRFGKQKQYLFVAEDVQRGYRLLWNSKTRPAAPF